MRDNIRREYGQRQTFLTPAYGQLVGDSSKNTTQGDALRNFLNSAVLVVGGLAISGVDAATFKTASTLRYNLAGCQLSKTAEDEIAFSAADTINTGTATGDFHGAWLVQVDADGTVSTKPAGGLSDQVYESKAAAVAALPDADADNVAIGYITVQANTNSAWTANTDDMTDGSDCVEATFNDADVDALPSVIS